MFFFFNDTATTEIYTLSLHDALPIFALPGAKPASQRRPADERTHLRDRPSPGTRLLPQPGAQSDRKSTRLNSSHANISYAVFCLKKKKNTHINDVPILAVAITMIRCH